jgi:hypothetical protein
VVSAAKAKAAAVFRLIRQLGRRCDGFSRDLSFRRE